MASALRRGLNLAMLAALSACAPVVVGQGPVIRPPALTATAIEAPDGTDLPLTITPAEPRRGPALAAIIALHGFNDYAAHFDLAASFWADQGIITYAYDQRGFGRGRDKGLWAGDAALIQDARLAIDLVRARHPGLPVVLVGSSMGGAVAVAAAGEPGFRADGVVLVSPALWGFRALNPVYRSLLWVSAHAAPTWTVTGQGLQVRPSDNIPRLRRMSFDPLVIKATRIDALYGLTQLMDRALDGPQRLTTPTLILFSDRDDIVPDRPVREALDRIAAPCRFISVQGGYHMLLVDLSAKRVWSEIADFALGRRRPQAPGCARDTWPPVPPDAD